MEEVIDPTIYKIFSFLLNENSDLKILDKILKNFSTNSGLSFEGIPQNANINNPIVLWANEGENASNPSIFLQSFSKTYGKDVILMMGVGKTSKFTFNSNQNEMTQLWENTFGQVSSWQSLVNKPDIQPVEKDKIRLTGQSWVYTTEWETIPEGKWETFSQNRFAEGGFIIFDWGTIGYLPSTKNQDPKFEIHVISSQKSVRDNFLFGDGVPFFTDILKVTQFIIPRYKTEYTELRKGSKKSTELLQHIWENHPEVSNEFNSSLNTLVNAHHFHQPKLSEIEKSFQDGLTFLTDYSTKLLNITEEIHTIKINNNAIQHIIENNKGRISDFSSRHFYRVEMQLPLEQISVELEYHKLQKEAFQGRLDILNQLSNKQRSFYERQIAITGIIIGIIIGLGQIASALQQPSIFRSLIIAIIFILVFFLIVLAWKLQLLSALFSINPKSD